MNATRKQLERQFADVVAKDWLPVFQREAKRAGTTTAFLLGKGSRETNLKNIRGDFRNGVYNGYGVNQVDIGTYPKAPKEWSPANFEPFFVKGTDIYLSKVEQIEAGQGKSLSVRGRPFVGKKNLEADDIRRIATAAYNCGLWAYYHFSKGNNVDSTTTGKDYSRDVYDRAVEFADMLEKEGIEEDAVWMELHLQGKYARDAHFKRFKLERGQYAANRLKLDHSEPMESDEELIRADFERDELEPEQDAFSQAISTTEASDDLPPKSAEVHTEDNPTYLPTSSAQPSIKTESIEVHSDDETLKKKETSFSPVSLPMLIPKITAARRWLGGGAITALFATISAYAAGLPPWLVFLLGFVTGMLVMGLIWVIVANVHRVSAMWQTAAEVNADPAKNNLQLIGDRDRYRVAAEKVYELVKANV